MATPIPIPIDWTTPETGANVGNAVWDPHAFANHENSHWLFLANVAGNIFGRVPIPSNVAPTPNAKIEFFMGANSTVASPNDVTRMQIKTGAVADGENWNTVTMVAETASDIALGSTAWVIKKTTITLTNAPTASDILAVQLFHDGTHVNDKLAADSVLIESWLLIDVV